VDAYRRYGSAYRYDWPQLSRQFDLLAVRFREVRPAGQGRYATWAGPLSSPMRRHFGLTPAEVRAALRHAPPGTPSAPDPGGWG